MTSQDKPLLQNTADSRFTNEAMADEFLRFLEGYMRQKELSRTRFMVISLSLHLYFTFFENGLKKNMKISS